MLLHDENVSRLRILEDVAMITLQSLDNKQKFIASLHLGIDRGGEILYVLN